MRISAGLSAVSLLFLSACSTAGIQGRIDELEAERSDLIRTNTEIQADLTACRARCAAYEQQARGGAPSRSTGSELPDDLTGQGIRVKRNGNGETVIDIPSDVFFSSGVSELSSNGKAALQRVADIIRRDYPAATFRVEGHADSDPIRRTKGKYHCNWDLSIDRAHSVVHYLVEDAKFDPRSIICAGYGEFRPQDPVNKSKNRRVEIVIVQ